MYGYSLNSSKQLFTIGDTPALQNVSMLKDADWGYESSPAIGRASRFSEKANKFATWCSAGVDRPGQLLNYVLLDPNSLMVEPLQAKSKVYPDSGAFFRESDESDAKLNSVLWNMKRDGYQVNYHEQEQINSVMLSAYGKKIITNHGYASHGSAGELVGHPYHSLPNADLQSTIIFSNYDVCENIFGV